LAQGDGMKNGIVHEIIYGIPTPEQIRLIEKKMDEQNRGTIKVKQEVFYSNGKPAIMRFWFDQRMSNMIITWKESTREVFFEKESRKR